ncbi:MAG: dihydroorotate dehydrogenase electron transfer subunit [Hydrogenothermaceae bacterium]
MIVDIRAKILENRFVSGKTWLMRLEAPEIAKYSKPAQFVMVKPTTEDSFDPLLRRAFAIADVDGDEIVLYYDIHGRGTKVLSERKVGEYVDVLGPLGKQLFPEDYKSYILVGGGIGFAGLSLLMKYLRDKGKKFIALYGARSKEDLSMIEWVKEKSFDVIYYTDDGSFGKKGLITQDLESIIEENPDSALAVCGPTPMMKAVAKIAKQKNVPCYLSLETKMACGIGICIGCVVKDIESDNYVRVCYEGPVFEASEIEF